MKNKSTILIMALAIMAAFTGCKKNEIDIEDELKELSNETFQSLEYCSHVEANGYNMGVIQLHFNHADNTVEKTDFAFGDGVSTVLEKKTYSFEWEEFTSSMLGRKARLVAGDEVLHLIYLNNVFTLSDTVHMTEKAALAGTTARPIIRTSARRRGMPRVLKFMMILLSCHSSSRSNRSMISCFVMPHAAAS